MQYITSFEIDHGVTVRVCIRNMKYVNVLSVIMKSHLSIEGYNRKRHFAYFRCVGIITGVDQSLSYVGMGKNERAVLRHIFITSGVVTVVTAADLVGLARDRVSFEQVRAASSFFFF